MSGGHELAEWEYKSIFAIRFDSFFSGDSRFHNYWAMPVLLASYVWAPMVKVVSGSFRKQFEHLSRKSPWSKTRKRGLSHSLSHFPIDSQARSRWHENSPVNFYFRRKDPTYHLESDRTIWDPQRGKVWKKAGQGPICNRDPPPTILTFLELRGHCAFLGLLDLSTDDADLWGLIMVDHYGPFKRYMLHVNG